MIVGAVVERLVESGLCTHKDVLVKVKAEQDASLEGRPGTSP